MDEAKRKELFDQLRTLLETYSGVLEVSEVPGKYSLSTTKPIVVDGKSHPNGYYFGGLREQKNIVGFYFMPIYVCPELREQVPESLRKVLKGNTCFNLKKLTPEMESDLKEMMNAGIETYRKMGWI